MNYIIANENRILEIDRRLQDLGREAGERRKKAAADFETAKDNYKWSLIVLAITVVTTLTSLGQ